MVRGWHLHTLDFLSDLPGGGQHGRPPKQVLCYGAGPEAPTGSHPGPGLHGERAPDPVLQIHPLQANQDHLLQGRGVRGAVQTCNTLFFLLTYLL